MLFFFVVLQAANVLVHPKEGVKLADFGSAKVLENLENETAPSRNYGFTYLWTAPEVFVDGYNVKVDVWSLGCVMIEMASARKPWDEYAFDNPLNFIFFVSGRGSAPRKNRGEKSKVEEIKENEVKTGTTDDGKIRFPSPELPCNISKEMKGSCLLIMWAMAFLFLLPFVFNYCN